MSQSPATVSDQIQRAFAATPAPGESEITADQTERDLEGANVARVFQGRDWRQIPPELLVRHQEALPLFTPAAFRYYLPAYLQGFLSSSEVQEVTVDPLLFNLTPPGSVPDWEKDWFQERAGRFSSAESAAICSFLKFLQSSLVGREERAAAAVDFWCGERGRRTDTEKTAGSKGFPDYGPRGFAP